MSPDHAEGNTMTENGKYCGECVFLSVTEQEQADCKGRMPDHFCNLLDELILHRGHHPELPRANECIEMGYKDEL